MAVQIVKCRDNCIENPHRLFYVPFTGKMEKSLRRPVRRNPLFYVPNTYNCIEKNVPRCIFERQNTSYFYPLSLTTRMTEMSISTPLVPFFPENDSLDNLNQRRMNSSEEFEKERPVSPIPPVEIVPSEDTIKPVPLKGCLSRKKKYLKTRAKKVQFDNFRDVRFIEDRLGIFEHTNKNELWYNAADFVDFKNSAMLDVHFYRLRYPEHLNDMYMMKRVWCGTNYEECKYNNIINSITTFSRNNIVKKFRNNI